jgi:SAM-dependent methyltransferase
MTLTRITNLDPWISTILAHPVTKLSLEPTSFHTVKGVIDARVFLRTTAGYSTWAEGQTVYEDWQQTDKTSKEGYLAEIDYDRPIYEHYRMLGRILDNGGGAGTVREFLPQNVEFVSTDPWLFAPVANSEARKAAYTCLNQPLNFIAATAEFLPFVAESFDWVHMRSMLDHVQVPDLVLLEAHRVLKQEGRILIGLYVEGGKAGRSSMNRRIKNLVRFGLSAAGIDRWKDHHVWHPTYTQLVKLINDNGFSIEDTYWQPHWNDTVCYICAKKTL